MGRPNCSRTCVLRGSRNTPCRATRALGGEQRERKLTDDATAGVGQEAERCRALGVRHVGHPPRGVETHARSDRELICGDDIPSAVGRQQDQLGEGRAESRRFERHRAAHAAIGEPRQERGARGVVAEAVDRGRRQNGGEERPRGARSPELFEHDRELGQPVARPADVFGQVQPEPSEAARSSQKGGRVSGASSSNARGTAGGQ